MSMDEQNPASIAAVDEQSPAPEQDNPELDAKVLDDLGGDKAKFDALTEPEFQAIAEQPAHELEYDKSGEFNQTTLTDEPGSLDPEASPIAVSSPDPADDFVAAVHAAVPSMPAEPSLEERVAVLELKLSRLDQNLSDVLARMARHGIVLS